MLGIAKALGITPGSALHDMSYVNALMYSLAMPTADVEQQDDRPEFDESKDACDPSNFEEFTDEEIVRI